jgi:hypothetical protein
MKHSAINNTIMHNNLPEACASALEGHQKLSFEKIILFLYSIKFSLDWVTLKIIALPIKENIYT